MPFATHKDLPHTCPVCGKSWDAVTAVEEDQPNRPVPGDITVCIDCISVLAFDENLQLREPTAEEMYEIAGNPLLKRAIDIAHRRKQRGSSHSS